MPPITVSLRLIFATPVPGWEAKLGMLALGLGLIVVHWLPMMRAKAILGAIGPVPLQLFGAVFGVLQLALGLEFILAAVAMLAAAPAL